MMLSRWSLRAGLGLLLVLSACGGRIPVTSGSPEPGGIGIVNRVTDRIEHGDSPNHLEIVAESQEFVAGDVLRVADGGEGLLDFGEYLQLRLFNDTEMRVIKAEHGTDIPLLARIRLEHGGFTGNLAEEGSEAVFETPNGAEITILGTQFFLVYDSESQVLGVGNFTGTVSLSVSGQGMPVSSGYYVVVRQDQPPEPERPIRISMTDFEQSSRTLVSPVVAFHALIESPISSASAAALTERAVTEFVPTPTAIPTQTASLAPPTAAPSDTATVRPTFTRAPPTRTRRPRSTATPAPPTRTRTPVPTATHPPTITPSGMPTVPSNTPIPPTNTVPPTNTQVPPPTDTQVPPPTETPAELNIDY